MALVDEAKRVRGLPRETGDVDVQEAVEDNSDANLLPRLSLDRGLRALPVVHETAGHVPMALGETADGLHHQDPRPLGQDDLRHAADERRVDCALHQRVDVAPLEDRVPPEPLFRMMVDERFLAHDAVRTEVHYPVRLGWKRKRLIRAGKPELPVIADEVNLSVRLDVRVLAVAPLRHSFRVHDPGLY